MNKMQLVNKITELEEEREQLSAILLEVEAYLTNSKYELRDLELAEYGFKYMQRFTITEELLKLPHIHDAHWKIGESAFIGSVVSSNGTFYIYGSSWDSGRLSHGIGGVTFDAIRAGLDNK